MSRNRISGLVLLAVMALGLPRQGEATPTGDSVELITGEVLFGKVLRESAAEVSIQLDSGGILSFRAHMVRRVRKRAPEPAGPAQGTAAGSSDALEPFDRPLPRPVDLTSILRSQNRWPISPAGSTKPVAASAPSAPLPRSTEIRTPVVDEVHGLSILPPREFTRLPVQAGSDLVDRYVEPLTQGSFQITAYATESPLLDVKKKVTQTYAQRFEDLRIEQDSPLDTLGFDGWMVEVRGRLGKVQVRQIQVFVRSAGTVLILTFSTGEESWSRLESSFQESIRSIKLIEPRSAPAPEPPPGPAPPSP